MQDITECGKSTSPIDEWWRAIFLGHMCVCVYVWLGGVYSGWVGGGWGIAAIRAFTTHLNEWIFRAFRICILMEPVARCSCFSKQKHWQFYWVYFFAPVFTLGQSTRNCCWHFLPCCHWWISAVSQTGGRRTEPIFFFSFFLGHVFSAHFITFSKPFGHSMHQQSDRQRCCITVLWSYTRMCVQEKRYINRCGRNMYFFFSQSYHSGHNLQSK